MNKKKPYKFIVFILLSSVDFLLGGFFFIINSLFAAYKFYSHKIPIPTEKNFKKQTFMYKNNGSRDLKLDIWYPNKKKKIYPLVVFSHGGGWISGFRNQPNNVSWCEYLASKGFAVASIDYSLGYFFSMEDILTDYDDAITFLRKHAGDCSLDTDNIFLMGLSAGGHLALMYSTYYTQLKNFKKMQGIRGVVAYYSPSILKSIGEENHESNFAKYAIRTTLKGSAEYKASDYERFSPINYVSSDMIPTFLAHGEIDTVVPFDNSQKLYAALKSANVYVKLITHKKGDHCFDFNLKDIRTVYIIEETLKFMERRLKDDNIV